MFYVLQTPLGIICGKKCSTGCRWLGISGKLTCHRIRLSLSISSNQVAIMKKSVNKTIVLAWLTMRREKSLPLYRLGEGRVL